MFVILQEWRLGAVLTVWRAAAKSGSKPVVMPVPVDACQCFRVAELSPVTNTKEGTFRATIASMTVVCPAHRMGLVLRTEEVRTGVDGFQVVLGKKELDIVEAAKAWTQWSAINPRSNLLLNRKRKASDPGEIILLDDDNDDDDKNQNGPETSEAEAAKPRRFGEMVFMFWAETGCPGLQLTYIYIFFLSI